MSLTFQERISLSTKSIENYRLHAPSVLEELSSNSNQNSQPFLDNIEKIVLSNSEQPSRKFYALYLLLKATENKPSQDFLAKLSFKNDLNSHISQTAQYDMDKLGPMNEKGKTLFFTSPSPSQAITGTNYVRLCAECVLYWGKRFGKDEPNHSFYGFWFQNQIVSKRVNLNATYNFVGKTYYGKEELAAVDFTLPPKVNDIRQPPNFNLESSQSIQEVILDNSLSSKKDLLESGTTFIKKKTPDFNKINQETIIKPLGKAEGIKKSVHSITPETEQIPLAQLSNAFHERAPSQPKGLKRLPSNAEESSKAHIQQEIQGNGFSLAQLSNTYHQYQPQPAEVLKKVETEIPQITRNGEALKKSFQSADRGQMQIPISQGGFESLERGFTPPQASPKTKVAQSNSVPADKTSPLDFKVEKEIELKRPFATLFKNDSLPNPRSPATIPVVTRVVEEPRRSFEPILRPSTGKAQSLSQMKNEQDILQVARLNSDLIQANQSFDENGRKSLSRQGSLLGQGKNVKIVFSDKGDDEEDLVNDSLFAREQVDTPKDLVSMVNHHAKPQEKVKSSIPKRQVPEEDINEEGPIQNLQGPVKVKVAARVDPAEQERVSHKFRPTLSQERASVGRNTVYDDPNATEEFYKENPYILMTQNESYKQENMYLMEEVQKYQEELRRRDEKEKFIEKQNHFLKARVANFDQELSEMRKSIGKLAETSQQLNQNLLSQTGSYSPFTPVKFDGSPDVMYSPIRSSETPRKNIFESPTYERPSALLNMAPRDSRK